MQLMSKQNNYNLFTVVSYLIDDSDDPEYRQPDAFLVSVSRLSC